MFLRSIFAAVLLFTLAAPLHADAIPFVRVDATHVFNMSQVTEVALRQVGNPGDPAQGWAIDVRFVGTKDSESVYFRDEKTAHDAWQHLLSELGVH